MSNEPTENPSGLNITLRVAALLIIPYVLILVIKALVG